MTINDPQNTTQNATDHEQHKTLHRMLPITSNTKPTYNRDELRCSGIVSSSCSTYGTRCVTGKRHERKFNYKKINRMKEAVALCTFSRF